MGEEISSESWLPLLESISGVLSLAASVTLGPALFLERSVILFVRVRVLGPRYYAALFVKSLCCAASEKYALLSHPRASVTRARAADIVG